MRPPPLVVALVLLVPTPGEALSRQPVPFESSDSADVSVTVRQVAGRSIYLDLGTQDGVEAGDTVLVSEDPGGAILGTLLVTAAGDVRSVLTFSGAPFAVTRGQVIRLRLRRAHRGRPPESLWGPGPATTRPLEPTAPAPETREGPNLKIPDATSPARAVQRGPRGLAGARGRMSLDVAAVHSATSVGAADPVVIDRTFTTPSLRLDVTVPEGLGGFTLRTSARLAYRYSRPTVLSRAASIRVYMASLEREFATLPLRVRFGRFHSPVESYSGFWDGLMLRYGHDALGVSALVGLQPDRWNQSPSLERPKATVALDTRRSGKGWRWQADLSTHWVHDGGSLPSHTFAGLSQRLKVGRVHLSQDLQLDRDPNTSTWQVSWLALRATLRLVRGLDVRAGASRRNTYQEFSTLDAFAPRRDRLSAGLSWSRSRGSVGVDVSRNRDMLGTSWGYTGSFAIFGLGRGIGTTATAFYSTGPRGNVLLLAPAISVVSGRTRMRVGYRLNHSRYFDRALMSHSPEASLDLPLRRAFRLSLRLSGQRGGGLSNEYLQFTLSRVF